MKTVQALRRKKRIRAKISGTADRPRIAVYRSNKSIYAQAIDDVKRETITSFSTLELQKGEKAEKAAKVATAQKVGEKLADKLKETKITQAVFDRGYYLYKGRVRALCEGLRGNGIQI